MSILDDPRTAEADAAAAYLARTRKMRRLRRVLALATLPLVLVGLVLAGKLLSMYPLAHTSISTYLTGDGEATVRTSQWLRPLNWFEPWKAPFNEGDGYALSDKLPEARKSFEESLRLANGIEQCAVRVNLSMVIERQGDAVPEGKTSAKAKKYYADALQVLADMPKECSSQQAQSKSSDPERNPQQEGDEQRKDLQEKQNQQGGQDKAPQGDQGDKDPGKDDPQQDKGPGKDKLDDIDKKLNEGQQERDDRDRGQQNGNEGDGNGGGTDKPW